jgi:hypothetical protein
MWKIIDGNLVDLNKICGIERVNGNKIQFISANSNKYLLASFESEEERDRIFESLKTILSAEEIK